METILKPFLDLLEEVYIGTSTKESWVIDAEPGHGFTAVIKNISAEMASRPMVTGGSTIAAHTGHLRWSIEFALEFFEGRAPDSDWKKSWSIKEVDAVSWKNLQEGLLEAYNKLTDTIRSHQDWSNPAFLKGTLALLPHVAYHLGAIKQLIIATQGHK